MGMSAGGGQGSGGPMAEINVTPLVDVMLVLIIIFMVVTPALTSGVDVKLPNAESGESSQDLGKHLVVAIKDDESVYVENRRVALEDNSLIDEINLAYQADPARPLLIKGDKRLTWKQVRNVMDTLNESGMTSMLLAVEKEKK